jgi:uncharacterized protein (DUF433 family)
MNTTELKEYINVLLDKNFTRYINSLAKIIEDYPVKREKALNELNAIYPDYDWKSEAFFTKGVAEKIKVLEDAVSVRAALREKVEVCDDLIALKSFEAYLCDVIKLVADQLDYSDEETALNTLRRKARQKLLETKAFVPKGGLIRVDRIVDGCDDGLTILKATRDLDYKALKAIEAAIEEAGYAEAIDDSLAASLGIELMRDHKVWFKLSSYYPYESSESICTSCTLEVIG